MTTTDIGTATSILSEKGKHEWVPSTLGHGIKMCKYCSMTLLEAQVLGDVCNKAPKDDPLDVRLQLLYPDNLGTQPNPTTQVGFRRDRMHKFADSLTVSELIGLTKLLTVKTMQKGLYVQIVWDILQFADAEDQLAVRKAIDSVFKKKED